MKFKIEYARCFLFVLFIGWMPISQAEGLPVVKDFSADAKESREKQVPIMVLFMSKTCSYCETVLQDFLLPLQRDPQYTNKVIYRQIDVDSKDAILDFHGSETTLKSFAKKHVDWGVPTVTFFDSQGNELSSIVGLLTVDFYLGFIFNAIEESQEKINAAAKSSGTNPQEIKLEKPQELKI